MKCSIKVNQIKWINTDSGNINPLEYEKYQGDADSTAGLVLLDGSLQRLQKRQTINLVKIPVDVSEFNKNITA